MRSRPATESVVDSDPASTPDLHENSLFSLSIDQNLLVVLSAWDFMKSLDLSA